MNGDTRNLEVVMNVSVVLTAELGRRSMRLAEVVRMGQGTLLELDRPADAPVDLLINGRLVARGEIVALNDRFGVRVSEVISRRTVRP